MSIEESLGESSWVTFVSPLVRIVERKEGSLSPPATTSEDPQVPPKYSASPDITGLASSATVSSGSATHFDLPLESYTETLVVGNLASTNAWAIDVTGFPADIFGPLVDMENRS